MWWMLLVIALALGVVAGPIINLMPSKTQRAAARLRTHAAESGLRVRLSELKNGRNQKSQPLVIYGLHWSGENDKALSRSQPWRLIRGDMEHDIHFHRQWDWTSRQLEADESWQQALKNLFAQAEGDPLFQRLGGLEWNGQGVQVYWTESSNIEDVDRLAALLLSLRDFGKNRSVLPTWPTPKTVPDPT